MNEQYFVFNKFSLFRASVLALLLPFLIACLVSITNMLLYGYGIPYWWLVISISPAILLGYKINISSNENSLTITRGFLHFPLFTRTFPIPYNTLVSWQPLPSKKGAFRLMIGTVITGLTIDR